MFCNAWFQHNGIKYKIIIQHVQHVQVMLLIWKQIIIYLFFIPEQSNHDLSTDVVINDGNLNTMVLSENIIRNYWIMKAILSNIHQYRQNMVEMDQNIQTMDMNDHTLHWWWTIMLKINMCIALHSTSPTMTMSPVNIQRNSHNQNLQLTLQTEKFVQTRV